MLISFLCGTGHCLSSVAIGIIGMVIGVALFRLEFIEGIRGDMAAWALLAFGFFYMAWGIWRGIKNRPHKHLHIHKDGKAHMHEHTHGDGDHAHVHEKKKANITPWVLFTVFVLGPCEPLIPLLIFPAAEGNPLTIIWVSLIFTGVTVATLMCITAFVVLGLSKVKLGKFERWGHAAAGGVVLVCGVLILVGL